MGQPSGTGIRWAVAACLLAHVVSADRAYIPYKRVVRVKVPSQAKPKQIVIPLHTLINK